MEVGIASRKASRTKFSVEEAREMMMRENSRLREIRVAEISYKVHHPSDPRNGVRLTQSTGPLGTGRQS